ncbi:MAG: flagellar protein FlaG [Acidobacteria bacterium]|nr:flagellar protein FlaG [Acidobacteriota bacterium]
MKVGEIAAVSATATSVEAAVSSPEVRQETSDRRAVLAAVKELDLPELNRPNRGLNISYDRETRQSIVQIVDLESGEVVQQFPGKDAVERAKYYREISGL